MTDQSSNETRIMHLERQLRDAHEVLRDKFAAQALNAFITSTADNTIVDPNKALSGVAKMSYMIADAMLKARKETQHEQP